jgi:hypothetical protein
MKRIFLTSCAAAALAGGLWAQIQRTPERLSAWLYFKEIQVPRGTTGVVDFLLDRETLDHARDDGSDVRLYDRANREIPYMLRVLRGVETNSAYPAREFNRGVEGGLAQVYCDLGDQPQEHNRVEIETTGSNFRRLADVQGSPDNAHWSTLASEAILFRFAADGRTVQQQAVAYPVSRHRYLRIRVSRDPQVDRAAPEITSVSIRRSVQMKGEMIPFAGNIEGREADRVNSRPASVWRVDLGGRVPVQRLVIATSDAAFSRPFQVEENDDPSAPVAIASGELTRRVDAEMKQPTIDFSEHFARRLKLTITDDRNAALSITGVTALSPARQVVFASPSADAPPVRMYYGNPKAPAPHYDIGARLPADPAFVPLRLSLGLQRENPIYSPEPKPFSERSPWLAYVVLAAASLILAAILINLVRTSERKAPAV